MFKQFNYYTRLNLDSNFVGFFFKQKWHIMLGMHCSDFAWAAMAVWHTTPSKHTNSLNDSSNSRQDQKESGWLQSAGIERAGGAGDCRDSKSCSWGKVVSVCRVALGLPPAQVLGGSWWVKDLVPRQIWCWRWDGVSSKLRASGNNALHHVGHQGATLHSWSLLKIAHSQ